MSKLKNMRIISIPKFTAVSSGAHPLNELFGAGGFSEWCNAHPLLLRDSLYECMDFLWHENNSIDTSVYIWAVRDGVTAADVAPYALIEFPGGLFLVATADEKDNDDLNETVDCMYQWIENSDVFEYGDFPQSGMCNMPGPEADRLLGIAQQQIFLPLKPVIKNQETIL